MEFIENLYMTDGIRFSDLSSVCKLSCGSIAFSKPDSILVNQYEEGKNKLVEGKKA